MPAGRLLLSGLLRDYAEELATTYGRLGCRVVVSRVRGEFCTLLLQRG